MKKNAKTIALFAKFADLGRKLERLTATFEDYETESGTTLIIDGEPAVDKEAKVLDSETNEEAAAPDGDYILVADPFKGCAVKVVGGVITEVVQVADAEMADAETFEEMMTQMYDLLWKLTDRYSDLVSQVGVLKDLQETNGAIIVEMQEQVQKWGKAPAAPTAQRRKPTIEAPAKFEETLTPAQRLQLAKRKAIKDAEARAAAANGIK